MAIYVIEDAIHAEPQGEFANLADAVSELHRLANVPWDQAPNRAPCHSWNSCGRAYEVIEYDDTQKPWRQVQRAKALDISKAGVTWHQPFGPPKT